MSVKAPFFRFARTLASDASRHISGQALVLDGGASVAWHIYTSVNLKEH
jgi:hypothetical protein